MDDRNEGIEKYITATNRVNFINLILSHDAAINKDRMIIVVEGVSDCKLFKKMFSSEVYVMESFAGKVGVQDIIESVDSCRVIGIRDRDYCLDINCERLFFTDYCCLEMMMIADDDTFESIMCEYDFDIGDIVTDPLRIRCYLLKQLLRISLLRKMNEQRRSNIRFIDNLCSNHWKDNRILYDSLFEALKNNNQEKEDDIDDLIRDVENMKRHYETEESLLCITNGHDFISLFHAAYGSHVKNTTDDRRTNRKKMPGRDQIESSIRVAYSYPSFKRTKLYSSIREYSQKWGLKIMK